MFIWFIHKWTASLVFLYQSLFNGLTLGGEWRSNSLRVLIKREFCFYELWVWVFILCSVTNKNCLCRPSQICKTKQKQPGSVFFWMKNEVYYKQRQRAVSGHLAAVSSVQTTPFWIFVSWLFAQRPRRLRSQTAPYALCSTPFSTRSLPPCTTTPSMRYSALCCVLSPFSLSSSFFPVHSFPL